MEKFYTLFSVTKELLSCAAIFHHGKTHDRLLIVGQEHLVTFVLPDYLSHVQEGDVYIAFNPDMVDIKSAVISKEIGRFYTGATLLITLVTRDIGSTKIGITTPHMPGINLKTFLAHVTERPQLAS